MIITKVISSVLDSIGRRFVKFTAFGRSDVQEKLQISPFGIDSNPIKDMVAVYSPTNEKGKAVVVGYINKNQLADVGETRIFSEDSGGNAVMFLHLKNDGTAQFGGNSDFMVRFSELKTGFDDLKTDTNKMIQEWNLFAAAYVPGSPTALGTPPIANTTPVSAASIDSSKIDEIKTL